MVKTFWGKSVSINLSGCNSHISNPAKIKEFVDILCREIRMKKFGPLHIEKFGSGDLEGYSCMQFIETSSITCHFDEKKDKTNRAFIDIFSCKEFDEKKAIESCSKFFEAKKAKMKVFIRK